MEWVLEMTMMEHGAFLEWSHSLIEAAQEAENVGVKMGIDSLNKAMCHTEQLMQLKQGCAVLH